MELESWGDGPLDATNFRAICFQPGEQKIWDVVPHGGKGGTGGRGAVRKKKLESYAMSEDCLTLNIYVPLVSHLPYCPSDPQSLPICLP